MLLVAKRALLSRAAALVLTGAAVLCAIALVSTARGALASDSALNGDDDAAGDGDAPPSALKAGLFTCAAGATADDALGIDYACNDLRYASPSTYLHSYAAGGADPQYDLLIVGAGVQAAYLVDNLRDALGKVAFNKLRIGIFEAERMTGGRLMSAWGGGDLSYTSQLRSPGDTVPMEYGGMRIDPKTHFLAFDALRKTAKWHDPDAKCERNNDVNPGTILKADGSDQAGVSVLMDALKALYGGEGVYTGLGQTADCPGYLTHMNTAVMRYFTNGSKAEFGDYLRSSTLFDDGSVEAGCLDLIGHTNTLFEANREKMLNESKSFVELVNNACTFACKQTDTYADFCTLCAKFPPGRQGQNLVSCIGYDDLPGVSPAVGIDEAAAVTGRGDYSCTPATSPGCSYLYLFNHGMQTFAQELLAGKPNTGFNPVGVIFEKRLKGVKYDGADAKPLAAALTGKHKVKEWASPVAHTDAPAAPKTLTLDFEDGSSVSAKAAYLTMVPDDLTKIDTFSPWAPLSEKAFMKFGADKLFMHWADGLPQKLKESTGDPDKPDDRKRLVLDGDRPGWVSRQVFQWDNRTILVYGTAPEDPTLPVNVMQQIIQTKGMNTAIQTVVDELNVAHGVTEDSADGIPMPSWARVKGWPGGTLSYYKEDCGELNVDPFAFSSRFERPLGEDVPLFYGSSEMNAHGGSGWVEGSLEEVVLNFQPIKAMLSDIAAGRA